MCLSFRNLILSGLLLMLTLETGAADTLKIHLIYKHKLDSTGHSTGRIAVNQQLYTPEGELFREISFDESTGQITGYVFYFYRHGRLFTQECYDQADSLLYILKHEYDQAGNDYRITRFISGGKGLIETEKTVRTFSNNHNMVEENHYYGRKLGRVTTYFYESGSRSQENSRFKPAAKSSYMQLTRLYTYSPGNQLIRVMVSGKEVNGSSFRYREEHGYDISGRLSEVKTLDAANAQTGNRVYHYLTNGSVSTFEEYNANGKLTLLLEYDYKMHFMESGTQVSRYEDF
jgi:hypothetical protein